MGQMGPGLFCPSCSFGTGSFLGKDKKDPVPFVPGSKKGEKSNVRKFWNKRTDRRTIKRS